MWLRPLPGGCRPVRVTFTVCKDTGWDGEDPGRSRCVAQERISIPINTYKACDDIRQTVNEVSRAWELPVTTFPCIESTLPQ